MAGVFPVRHKWRAGPKHTVFEASQGKTTSYPIIGPAEAVPSQPQVTAGTTQNRNKATLESRRTLPKLGISFGRDLARSRTRPMSTPTNEPRAQVKAPCHESASGAGQVMAEGNVRLGAGMITMYVSSVNCKQRDFQALFSYQKFYDFFFVVTEGCGHSVVF